MLLKVYEEVSKTRRYDQKNTKKMFMKKSS